MDRSDFIMGCIVLGVCTFGFLFLMWDIHVNGWGKTKTTTDWRDDGVATIPLPGRRRTRPTKRSSRKWNAFSDRVARLTAIVMVFLHDQVWWRNASFVLAYALGYVIGKARNLRITQWIKRRFGGITSNLAVKVLLLAVVAGIFVGVKLLIDLAAGKAKSATAAIPSVGMPSWLVTLGKVGGVILLFVMLYFIVRLIWRKRTGANASSATTKKAKADSGGGRAQLFWVLGTIYAIAGVGFALHLLWEPIGWTALSSMSAPLVSLAILFFLVFMPLDGIARSMVKGDDIKKKYESEVTIPKKIAFYGMVLWVVIGAWSVGSAAVATGQSFAAKLVDCTLGSYLACAKGGPLGRTPLGPAVQHGGERHYFVGMTKFAPVYPLAMTRSKVSKFYLDPEREANGFLTELAIDFEGTFSGQPVRGVVSVASSGVDGGSCETLTKDEKAYKVCSGLPWGIELASGQRMYQRGYASATILPDYSIEIGLTIEERVDGKAEVTYLGKVILEKNNKNM